MDRGLIDTHGVSLREALKAERPLLGGRSGYYLAQVGYAAGASRSSRRRILPTLVFGSSLRNSTIFGCL